MIVTAIESGFFLRGFSVFVLIRRMSHFHSP